MSSMAKLKQAASKKSATKKSTTPEVKVKGAVVQAIKDFRFAKQAETKAERERKEAEHIMTGPAEQLRVRLCQDHKELHPSARLVAEDGSEKILYTQKSQCKKMTDEHEDKMRSITGENDFDRWFDVQTVFSLNAEKLHQCGLADKVQEALLEALGDRLDILEVETVIVPTKRFYEDDILEPKAAKKIAKLRQLGFVQLHKPSFK